MPDTYLDAVLDSHMQPVFNGTAEKTVEWLQQNAPEYNDLYQVCIGTTMQLVSVNAYLAANKARKEVAKEAVVEPIIPSYYSRLVPKYYAMNPSEDELLADGTYIENGMKVLIEDPDNRGRIEFESLREDWRLDKALTWNRWCTVTDLRVHGGLLIFIGVYDDGTKRTRRVSLADPWLVKKGTIPKPSTDEVQATGRHTTVREIVWTALGLAANSENADLDEIADVTTRNILGLS